LNFPTIASNETIGLSFEGRPQTVLKLSNGGSANKIGIFIDAAIHAAEWLGPAVALNTIHQLTTDLATNQAYLDMADWYILPVANPDGYHHSWTEVNQFQLPLSLAVYSFILKPSTVWIFSRIACGAKLVARILDQIALAQIQIGILTSTGEVCFF
jgi:murein tripeptide amidase MpaA